MRFHLVILYTSFSLAGFAAFSTEAVWNASHIEKTNEERIHERVWLSVDEPSAILSPSELLTYGGVYVRKPIETLDDYLFAPNLAGFLAVQLDSRLNPVPDGLTNIPSLTTLASISDQELLLDYFQFLKEAAYGYGIRQLILPPLANTSEMTRNLLDLMQAYDPIFFVDHNRLKFGAVDTKKDFQSLFDQADFWVVERKEIVLVDKMISKHAKRLNIKEGDFAQASFLEKGNFKLSQKRLPNKMAVAISRASIVPLQRKAGLLPLKADTLCLITADPFGVMAQMLRKYTYLITTSNGIANSSAPIIIDNMIVDLSEFRVGQRTVIYTGEIDLGVKHYKGRMDAALLTSTSSPMYSYLLPQVLFGVASASGRMPLNHNVLSTYNNSAVYKRDILGYAPPEMTGLDETARNRIKSIITEAITTGSTPGCQVAIAVDGSIVLEEGYGYLTYDSLIATDTKTIYDLASVTKVSATLLAVMKLYEQGKIKLDTALSFYLPQFAGSNKSQITLRQILSHNAGLMSYVPFWERVINEERLETFYYKTEEDKRLDRRSYGLEVTPAVKDSLVSWIIQSPISNELHPKYKYSDIGFMILHQVVEAVSGQTMETYLTEHFYSDLGLRKVYFNPLEKGVERFEIAPTEYDYYFRNEQVWGQVHDRNAAIFGGVAGHAGLFSNAHDLLVIMQMLEQEGQYDGRQYLSPSTVRYFNNQYFEGNRRALGWDKRSDIARNVSSNASFESFGHTGFTGTVVWIDPQFDLVFIFLSNRVYPDANNYKLIQKDIRSRVQDVVYEAILANWVN